MKKIIFLMLAVFVLAANVIVFAEEAPSVDWKNIPATMKIGDYFSLSDNLSGSKIVTAKNLGSLTEDEESYLSFEFGMLSKAAFPLKDYFPPAIENGSCESFLPLGAVYKPGSYTIKAVIASDFDDATTAVGDPCKVTVAAPEITHNAPGNAFAGQEITLTTGLANTSLKNQQVSYFKNKNNYEDDGDGNVLINEMSGGVPNMIAYEPVITITAGADLVTRTSQDYTNTLKSSEKIKFNKAGTIKLTISYKQINTFSSLIKDSDLYSPQKSVTITVKETSSSAEISSTINSSKAISSAPASSGNNSSLPSISRSDSSTGIKITAPASTLSEGVTVSVSELGSGKEYKKLKSLLSDKTKKFLIYDISLRQSGDEVLPTEKFEISIPVPAGYDRKQITVYDLTESGKKTAVDISISGGAAVFETDHTGIFALTEDSAAGTKKTNVAGIVIFIILGVILLGLVVVGGLILYNYLDKNKKRVQRRR